MGEKPSPGDVEIIETIPVEPQWIWDLALFYLRQGEGTLKAALDKAAKEYGEVTRDPEIELPPERVPGSWESRPVFFVYERSFVLVGFPKEPRIEHRRTHTKRLDR
jgi:hypothetical protein